MRFNMDYEYYPTVKISNVSRVATTYHYGTCEVDADMSLAELSEIGLTPCSGTEAAEEADCVNLMRSEAPHMFA